MLEGIVLTLATLALAYVSKASLRVPKSHGFYRFFAWELMLLLIVMNIDGWYDVPVSFDQTISGILMAISLIVIIMGYGILHQLGERDDSRDDGALLLFEKTSVLVTHGDIPLYPPSDVRLVDLSGRRLVLQAHVLVERRHCAVRLRLPRHHVAGGRDRECPLLWRAVPGIHETHQALRPFPGVNQTASAVIMRST